jgi:hypothetical protein
MAVDFSRLTRAQVDQYIIRFAQDDRPFEVRPVAIQAVNDFADISPAQIDEDAFAAHVVSMVAKLDVAIPAVPADLGTLSEAQARTLAGQLELAEWDYRRRVQALADNHRYWVRQLALDRAAPNAAAYLAMLLKLMNYVRNKRGLAAVS